MVKTIDEIKALRSELEKERQELISLKKELISLKYDLKYKILTIKESEKTQQVGNKIREVKSQYLLKINDTKTRLNNSKKEYNVKEKEYLKYHNETLAALDKSSDEYAGLFNIGYIGSNNDFSYENVLMLSRKKKNSKHNLKQIERTKEAHLVQYLKKEAVLDEQKYNLLKLDYLDIKREFNESYKRLVDKVEDKALLRKEKTFWKYLYIFREWLINRFKKDILLLGRDIVVIFACISLALSLNYIRAIKQVTNSITAPLMFAFVLLGIVSIFNVTRMHQAYSKKFYFTSAMLLLTIACGLGMSVLCLTGIQSGVKIDLIYTGVITSFVVIAGYIFALALIIIARIREIKAAKK